MSKPSYMPPPCHCLTIRQAARQVTQLFDRVLAPTGLRITQYSMLRALERCQPITMQDFAESIVMDRTTLTRALRPLQRQDIIAIEPGRDGRTRVLTLTEVGLALVRDIAPAWEVAQAEFENRYGTHETQDLRGMLARVVEQMA